MSEKNETVSLAPVRVLGRLLARELDAGEPVTASTTAAALDPEMNVFSGRVFDPTPSLA